MAIKSVPLSVNRQTIEKKVEEDRDEGGGFLFFKTEPEKVSYFCLVGFPSVHIKYEHPEKLNKTTVMKETSTIIEPWLGEGRTNMPNESAADQVKYQGFSTLQKGYYISWSVMDESPESFAENFLASTKKLGGSPEDVEIKDVCYLPRFIVKLERSDEERYLVYNFKGEKIELISERLTNDSYYRERVEKNMSEIP